MAALQETTHPTGKQPKLLDQVRHTIRAKNDAPKTEETDFLRNKKKRLWELPYGEAVELGLQDRIVADGDRDVSYTRNTKTRDPT